MLKKLSLNLLKPNKQQVNIKLTEMLMEILKKNYLNQDKYIFCYQYLA